MRSVPLILLLYTGVLLLCLTGSVTSVDSQGGVPGPPGDNGSQQNPQTQAPGGTPGPATQPPAGQNTQAPIGDQTKAPSEQTTQAHAGETTQASAANNTNAPPGQNTQPPGETTQASVANNTQPPAGETTQRPVKDTTQATGEPTTKAPAATTQKPSATSGPATTKAATSKAATAKANTTQSTNTSQASTAQPPTTNKASTTNANTTQAPTTKAPYTTQPPTTQAPNATNATKTPATQPPATQPPTTQPPNATNTTKTPATQSPTTQANTTQPPTTQPPTTQAKITQANTTKAVKTKPPATQPPTTANTTKTPTTEASTAGPGPTPPAGQQMMYINEIMLNKQGGFQKIELYVTNGNSVDLTHYAMVMVDGSTDGTMSVTRLQTYTQTNGLIMVNFNSTNPMMKSEGIGVAIYDMTRMTTDFHAGWKVNKDGLVDALVIGKSYETISDHLVQTLTPGMNPFVLDPSLYGMEKTITRCSAKLVRNTDMFALVNPSMGLDNGDKCRERFHVQHSLALKFQADCKMFDGAAAGTSNKTMHLMRFVIKEVNRKCQCGMTKMHIRDAHVSCCGGTDLSMNIVAPNARQGDNLLTHYKAFIKSTTDVAVDGKLYKLDNSCYSDCCKQPVSSSQDDTSKNIRVTVGVVVTCVLIFLVIVILVILYMRRKKSAVYQFRMSRLDEEEDYPMGVGEQDDFVGGQEATFDLKA